jgi:hypothetical protein
MAAEEVDAVIATAREAEERIRTHEQSVSSALAAGDAGTPSARICAETMNSALERIVRIGAEAESVSRALKRGAAALSGRGGRSGGSASDPAQTREGLSLRQMPSRQQAVDRSR